MSRVEIVTGAARDAIRTISLAALRVRGDLTGQLMTTTTRTDPYPMYRRLREMGPVVRTTMGPLTTRHLICDAILRHPESVTGTTMRADIAGGSDRFQQWLFSAPSRDGMINPIGPESMIGMNNPDHARIRSLVSKVFTRRAIDRLRPRLVQLAEDLVHDTRQQETFDLMTSIAGVFPVLAICELLGIPQPDHARFRRWGSAISADLDALTSAPRQRKATKALLGMHAYFSDLFEDRRRAPGDDLISELIGVEDEGERLNSRELLATCNLLLFAGFETTVNLIGNGTLALIGHRDQLDLLRADPTLIPGAIEELLRYDAPIQVTARMPTRDIEIDGIALPANEPVSLLLGGANRDPDVFAEPDTLDIRRADARRHLSFAAGPHHCLGAALARLEAEIIFTVLLDQLGNLQLAGRPRRRPTFVLRALDSLPLRGTASGLP
jgi:cytochrome P450